ncbi:hypothetical protein TL16_g01877 [Triparma laevis f. inornata]|uniref:AB hydrolase-1 domain-containing protein n=1 Tax=Triparma laevis f. inornata TaxID=1714386 RepID=A0A9W6ZQI8_9STRA|nr:hypothetical protein TL16_g01877 [Triparma laevis f. inornata]
MTLLTLVILLLALTITTPLPQFLTTPTSKIAFSVTTPPTSAASAPPLLLLNGFGVGQFHQKRLVSSLSRSPTFSSIYTLDYLGQGDSWPLSIPPTTNLDSIGTSPSEANLNYSVETWIEQVHDFITSTILPNAESPSIAIAGNSLGGYIATILAKRYPDLFSTLILFNATPIWGGIFASSPLTNWDGVLPAPTLPRFIGKTIYDQIRDPQNVYTLMAECYATPLAHTSDRICEKIIGAASK